MSKPAERLLNGASEICGNVLPSFLALPMLDTAVNPGWKSACTWLQEALGVPADGEIGSATIGALGKLDGRSLVRAALAIQDKREAYYRARPDYLHGHPFGAPTRLAGSTA